MHPIVLNFYRDHSPFTDPGAHAACFAALPRDLPGIVRAIQGLIIPPYAYTLEPHGLEPADIEDAGFGYRKIETLIAKLLAICAAPLSEPRPPRLRLGVNCRNFATLLVSVLRHMGIPARERIGFEGYLGGAIHYEHRIAEAWLAERGRWTRVDAFVDPNLAAAQAIALDPLNIAPSDPFYPAAAVWLDARAGRLDPDQFGDSPQDIGLPPIRYALLHDLDALNKFEVLGNDTWGDLIDMPQADLTAADMRFLDEVASLTLDPDAAFDAMTALHSKSEYGKQLRATAGAMGL